MGGQGSRLGNEQKPYKIIIDKLNARKNRNETSNRGQSAQTVSEQVPTPAEIVSDEYGVPENEQNQQQLQYASMPPTSLPPINDQPRRSLSKSDVYFPVRPGRSNTLGSPKRPSPLPTMQVSYANLVSRISIDSSSQPHSAHTATSAVAPIVPERSPQKFDDEASREVNPVEEEGRAQRQSRHDRPLAVGVLGLLQI